jgi:hypothetical protein
MSVRIILLINDDVVVPGNTGPALNTRHDGLERSTFCLGFYPTDELTTDDALMHKGISYLSALPFAAH